MSEIKVRVALIFGGHSGEHEVSCKSAASIMTHLDRDRYDVLPIKIGLDRRWRVVSDPLAPTDEAEGAELSVRASMAEGLRLLDGVDVVFPALHGPFGEDGTIQGMLELAGIPYVGNGVLASASAMDKDCTKTLLAAAGLRVADAVVLQPGESEVDAAARERLGLPVFVKPARAGSSLGVSKVDRWEELPAAIAEARKTDQKVLVEAAAHGREVDIGVLELSDGTLKASPSLEIRLPEGGPAFFDFHAKYQAASTIFDIPAQLDAATTARLEAAALRAFQVLGCSGLLRVDCFVDADGEPTLNEVNTFPGFTAASQYPQMWQQAGLSYPELLHTLIQTALFRADNAPRPELYGTQLVRS